MAYDNLSPFVSSGEILRLLGIYKMLDMHCRPSELLEIEDAYTAFCFDEVCSYIIKRMKDGEVPVARASEGDNKHYSKPSDFYKRFE